MAHCVEPLAGKLGVGGGVHPAEDAFAVGFAEVIGRVHDEKVHTALRKPSEGVKGVPDDNPVFRQIVDFRGSEALKKALGLLLRREPEGSVTRRSLFGVHLPLLVFILIKSCLSYHKPARFTMPPIVDTVKLYSIMIREDVR
jgi:hypothetical protein